MGVGSSLELETFSALELLLTLLALVPELELVEPVVPAELLLLALLELLATLLLLALLELLATLLLLALLELLATLLLLALLELLATLLLLALLELDVAGQVTSLYQ